MPRSEFWMGLCAAVAGVVIVGMSLSLPQLPHSYAGPGLFPAFVGAGLTLVGAWISLSQWRQRPEPGAADPFSWRGVLEVVAAVLLFMALSPRIGFSLSAFAMVGGMLLARGTRPVTGIAVALALTLVVRWMFGVLLRVPLPEGPWGW